MKFPCRKYLDLGRSNLKGDKTGLDKEEDKGRECKEEWGLGNSRIESHKRLSECLGSLGGFEWVVAPRGCSEG